VISFVGDTLEDQHGGRIYRRLGENRLLISEAFADSGTVGSNDSPWYFAYERLAVIGDHPWQASVGGKPALAEGASGSDRSGGFLLPDGTLFWTSVSIRDDRSEIVRRVIDLETGQERAEAPQRNLEGLCRP